MLSSSAAKNLGKLCSASVGLVSRPSVNWGGESCKCSLTHLLTHSLTHSTVHLSIVTIRIQVILITTLSHSSHSSESTTREHCQTACMATGTPASFTILAMAAACDCIACTPPAYRHQSCVRALSVSTLPTLTLAELLNARYYSNKLNIFNQPSEINPII